MAWPKTSKKLKKKKKTAVVENLNRGQKYIFPSGSGQDTTLHSIANDDVTLGKSLSPELHFFFKKKIYLFIYIYFWLFWVFVSVRGLSPVAESGGHSSSRCAGL